MVIFKEATIDDIELINSIAFDTFYATYSSILSEEQIKYMFDMMYSLQSLHNQIEINGSKYFIVHKDDKVCGYMSITEEKQGKFHLDKIYLLETFQGQGLGKTMINYAIDYVRNISSVDISSLCLNVNRNNKAINFYKAMGFEIVETGDFDIGNGYFMNDYIMQIIVR